MKVDKKVRLLMSNLSKDIFEDMDEEGGKSIEFIEETFPEQDLEQDLNRIIQPLALPCLMDFYNLSCFSNGKAPSFETEDTFFSNFDVNKFWGKYTLLRDDIVNEFDMHIKELREIGQYYKAERFNIQAAFGHQFGHGINIESWKGDIHGGRTVATVNFEGGRLMYKPQAYRQQKLLEEIMEILNSDEARPTKFRFPRTYSKNRHCWVEYVEDQKLPVNCSKNCFYEIGLYLAVFFALRSNDMHFENMLINGGHPVFIDLETLCGVSTKTGISNRELANSVLSTGVLPTTKTKLLDLNVSAVFRDVREKSETIFQKEIQFDEHHGFVVKNKKTSVAFNQDLLNSQLLYGTRDCLLALENGFSHGMEKIIHSKAFVLEILGQYLSEENFQARKVLRSTQVYAEFLEALRNPSTRRDERQDKILGLLGKMAGNGILCDERKSLRSGWVPSYYVNGDGFDLVNSVGEVVEKDFVRESVLQQISEWILKLSDEDVVYQDRLIRLSYCSTHIAEMSVPVGAETRSFRDCVRMFLKNFDKYRVSEKKPIYYSMQLLPNCKTNIWSLSPGLFNASGWVLILAIYGLSEHEAAAIKVAQEINNSLMGQISDGTLETHFGVDGSLETGISGSIFVNQFLRDHGVDTMYSQADLKINTLGMKEEDKKILTKLKNGEYPLNLVISRLRSASMQRASYSHGDLMSPVTSGALGEFIKWEGQ